MEDRIKKFMDYKGISPSELADTIGVQRSNVTHVLKGRNKPSFQFIEKMLQIYPELNAKWLLLGTGSMVDSPTKSRSLFDQVIDEPIQPATKPKAEEVKSEIPIIEEPRKELTDTKSSSVSTEKNDLHNNLQDQFFSSEKPIERLIVFFKDATFKVYNPSR
ncbi:MAG: helix-turn-helix transcriptional regulator [Prolixibacteraceae bacterium]|nr:helix-turn-helix transcriptional regulator [Prolixibacteraceae bacterium]